MLRSLKVPRLWTAFGVDPRMTRCLPFVFKSKCEQLRICRSSLNEWNHSETDDLDPPSTSAKFNALAGKLGRRGFSKMICSENSEEARTCILQSRKQLCLKCTQQWRLQPLIAALSVIRVIFSLR